MRHPVKRANPPRNRAAARVGEPLCSPFVLPLKPMRPEEGTLGPVERCPLIGRQ